MKFSTTFSVALLALAKLIAADSEEFGLLSIRSGSSLQYASVYYQDDKLYVGSGASSSLSGTVTDAGKLKFTEDTYAVVNSDGTITEGSEADATPEFSIKNGHLAYNDIDGFYAIPEDSSYVLSVNSGENSLGIAIKAVASNGQSVPDFTPSGSDDSSSSSSATEVPTETTSETPSETETEVSSETQTVAPSETETVAPSETETEVPSETQTVAPSETETVAPSETETETLAPSSSAAAISQIDDGQVQAIQTENAAPKAAVGLGAGIVAAAAALLI